MKDARHNADDEEHSPDVVTQKHSMMQDHTDGMRSSQQDQMMVKQTEQYHGSSIAEDMESNGHSPEPMHQMGSAGNPLQEFQRN